jgi:hypothetical protein
LYDGLFEEVPFLGVWIVAVADADIILLLLVVSLYIHRTHKAYLIFGEERIADACNQHHGHEEGDESFRRHSCEFVDGQVVWFGLKIVWRIILMAWEFVDCTINVLVRDSYRCVGGLEVASLFM